METSKVIHIRNVGAEIQERDIQQLAAQFGVPQKIVMLRTKNQALVQMPDLATAAQMIQYYTTVQPSIRARNVYMQYSSHKELTSAEGGVQQDVAPNRILLVTIHNPLYPISVDVLHQVFSPHGFVEKIVTFHKSAGLQALLQYSNQQSATSARNTLQGRNIYDGCCTLDIQFSNLQELQVNFNNEKTRDFTNNTLPAEAGGALRAAPGGAGAGANVMQSSLFGEGGNLYGMQPGGPRPGFQGGHPGMGMHPYGQVPGMQTAHGAAAAFGGPLPPGVTGTNDRCTILVSSLDPAMDPDKLFNLFSNYGNVVRIKILQNKPDHALVQMQDGFQAELAVNYLKGCVVFGKRMDVNYSKHAQINTSPDTRDFSSSNLNRFNRNAAKNYRHCCAPTRMLHCSSLPPDVTEDLLTAHLGAHGQIVGLKVYENNAKKQALVQFATEEMATEALVCKHAVPFSGATMRLAFSKLTTLT